MHHSADAGHRPVMTRRRPSRAQREQSVGSQSHRESRNPGHNYARFRRCTNIRAMSHTALTMTRPKRHLASIHDAPEPSYSSTVCSARSTSRSRSTRSYSERFSVTPAQDTRRRPQMVNRPQPSKLLAWRLASATSGGLPHVNVCQRWCAVTPMLRWAGKPGRPVSTLPKYLMTAVVL